MSGPTGQTKDAIDAFLVENYERLHRTARGITKHCGPAGPDSADELFSYMVSEVYSGRTSISEVAANGPTDLLRWATALMNMSFRSKKSAFSRLMSPMPTHQRHDFAGLSLGTAPDAILADVSGACLDDEGSRVVAHVFARTHDDSTSLDQATSEASSFQEAELLVDGMHPDRVAEFLAVSPCVQSMPLFQRILVELYFVDGLSIRRIAAEKGIPQSSVFEMVRTARTVLRDCIRSKAQPLF